MALHMLVSESIALFMGECFKIVGGNNLEELN
jgi:hypothetical protein